MEGKVRIAVVNPEKCKPKKCGKECQKVCPVVRMGKLECVVVTEVSTISEDLCIGCNLCVKKCPFNAISIVNLPKAIMTELSHRYGKNSFMLSRLPQPRRGQVLGLVGSNGTGKTTALKIIAGKVKPNFGNYENPPSWEEILERSRGSEIQKYFTRYLENKITFSYKPQYFDHIYKHFENKEKTVEEILTEMSDVQTKDQLVSDLNLGCVTGRTPEYMSGGEIQRFAIAFAAAKKAQMYMFDEPSSFLDIRQRLNAAKVIRNLLTEDNYVIVVEHDLSVLDFLSDYVCILYGTPSVFGVVTYPYSVRQGINIFLEGFIPASNMRFREVGINFKISEHVEKEDPNVAINHFNHSYPAMTHSFDLPENQIKSGFSLRVEPGDFRDSEIIVLLGENGTGKTTFIRMLAGQTKDPLMPKLNISYKPQKIAPKFEGTVRELLYNRAPMFTDPQFISDVVKPLNIMSFVDNKVKDLSGGELQRTALCLALGKPADIYLLDEPSAFLDSEQRVVASKVIKRFIMHAHKTAFVVEHDFIMATYLADRVIVYTGEPGRQCVANSPQSLLSGMNAFLASLNVTIRRDPTNYRPRINKLNCVKDREQKTAGTYFYVGDDDNEDY